MAGRTRNQTGRRDRSRIDHWIRPAALTPFDSLQGVERKSGRVDPNPLSRFLRTQGLTDQREYERLGYAHDRERAIKVASSIDVAAGANHAHAEQAFRHGRQRRIDFRVLAFSVRFELLIGFEYESHHKF